MGYPDSIETRSKYDSDNLFLSLQEEIASSANLLSPKKKLG